jgi:hypothetical protein
MTGYARKLVGDLVSTVCKEVLLFTLLSIFFLKVFLVEIIPYGFSWIGTYRLSGSSAANFIS